MAKSNRAWRKSTYSGATSGNCVEVGNGDDRILVRDTQAREACTLSVSPQAWLVFARSLK